MPLTASILELVVRGGGGLSLEGLRGYLEEDSRTSDYEVLKEHLEFCHEEGWVHKELGRLGVPERYIFSSELHYWYVAAMPPLIALELS